MAIPTVQINGNVLTPDGSAPASGTIVARLSQPGSVLDGATSQRVASRVSAQLGAGGALPVAFALVPNDAITPSGTYYEVTYLVQLADGSNVPAWREQWQLASTPNPVNIGAVPRLNVIPGVAVATSLAGAVAGLVAGSTAAAAANTAKIQAALDAGGTVYVAPFGAPPPTYYINKLAIGDRTRLVVSPSVTLRQAPGQNANLLVTKSYLAAQTAVAVTWSSGGTASVAWTAHPFAVGDYCALKGADQSAFVGVFLVSAVADVNNFTVRLVETPVAAASGAITGVKANVGFEVQGGVWDYNIADNPGGTFSNQHAVILAYAQGFSAHAMRYRSVPKYCVALGAVRDFRVYEQHAENGAPGAACSDVVKTYGPAFNGEVGHISGLVYDDLTSVQPVEPPAFAGYMFTGGGSIFGVKVHHAGGDDLFTPAVALYLPNGATPWKMDDIEVDVASGNEFGAVKIAGNLNGANYASVAGTITIRGVRSRASGAVPAFFVDQYAHVRNLILENFALDDPGLSTSAPATIINGQVDTLTLRGWETRFVQYALSVGGTGKVNVLNAFGIMADQVEAIIAVSGGQVGTINGEDCSLTTNIQAASAVAAAGGSGYALNDTITLAGGTSYSPTVLKVTGVTAGAVTSVSVQSPGSYMVKPNNPVAQASTSGVGTGATFTVTWGFSTAPTLVSPIATCTIGAVNLRGNRLDAGCHSLVRVNANSGATVFTLRENNSDSSLGVSTSWTCRAIFRDNIFSAASFGLLRVSDAGATQIFTVVGDGNSVASSPTFTRVQGAEKISIFSPDLKVDLATVQRTAGSQAVASVGAGTIVANNLTVCDATGAANSWHQVTAPANVF